MRRAVIQGIGSSLPKNAVSNHDLTRIVETSDEWIVERTGIKQRYLAAEGETTGSLAVAAARAALQDAGMEAQSIDLIVLGTSTPDNTFPATATFVQAELGMVRGAAFDVQAVCSGFVYALSIADSMVRTGSANRALVIGSETFSRILDWSDRTTCVLFGDGAGAVVLEAVEEAEGIEGRGVIATKLHSDGRYKDKLYVDGGPSTTKTVGVLRMEGKEVFKHAVVNISAVMTETLDSMGLTAADIDWIVPHQANKRILDSTAKRFGIPEDKVVITVDRHGNTSAASIPLALDVAVKDGRIKRGDLVLVEAMGGGFTWGAALIRW
ncbi:3-oxoacyl-[acyl-carrier-protein] synthase-3 [Rhodoligotrophos appendicifer]|uniref:beta-ketoacyl-ACP synthase III n=1 Tax=Rhodoligotrophos appendicifer TaxID=987056 RepID=UPI0011859FA3|nr:beta-ketoacyl-ACP synthase III [Rhodoligotrophos appendicifer]